jgi:hypothetical protein
VNAEKDCNCGTIRNCRSHLTATVRTEDGEMVSTERSPCLVCMDQVRLGSQIGLHRIGDRWIGRRYIDLFGRGLKNDVETMEPETCTIKGVAE